MLISSSFTSETNWNTTEPCSATGAPPPPIFFWLRRRQNMQKHKIFLQLDGKYSGRVQIPRKRFCRQHLATLATPTILRPASFEFPDEAIF